MGPCTSTDPPAASDEERCPSLPAESRDLPIFEERLGLELKVMLKERQQ